MATKRKPASPPPQKTTIYDDVYRTIVQKLSFLIIPAINEVFGTHYDMKTDISQLRNEHLELAGKIITDSIFRIGNLIYHIECQSTPDGTMALRMFEYDFAIALEEARKAKVPYRVKFPTPAVIYLRPDKRVRDFLALEVEFPDGQAVTYKVPVINVQEYSLDKIFEKWLWLFIPFYIMRYQKQFDDMEADKSKRQIMLSELDAINARLADFAKGANILSVYADLMQLSQQIADYMLKKQPKTKKEVRKIMGGKLLELHSEKMIKKGKREGLKEGRKEGESRLARLMSLLLKSGKAEEAAAASESEQLREELYKKYGIA